MKAKLIAGWYYLIPTALSLLLFLFVLTYGCNDYVYGTEVRPLSYEEYGFVNTSSRRLVGLASDLCYTLLSLLTMLNGAGIVLPAFRQSSCPRLRLAPLILIPTLGWEAYRLHLRLLSQVVHVRLYVDFLPLSYSYDLYRVSIHFAAFQHFYHLIPFLPYIYEKPGCASSYSRVFYHYGEKKRAQTNESASSSYNNNYGLRRGSQPHLFPSQSRSC